EKVIRYAFRVARVTKSHRIFFTYFAKKDWRKNLKLIQKPETTPFIEAKVLFTDYLREQVTRLTPEGVEADRIVMIEEGEPLTQILKLQNKHNIDLVVVGRKDTSPHSKILTKKLVRRAMCSVLCVPENPAPATHKIFIPISYDVYAHYAISRAIDFAKDAENEVELVCFNAYNLTEGFHAGGKTKQEFARRMLEISKMKYKNFMRSVNPQGVKIIPKFSLAERRNPAQNIYQTALVENADMIIMGSKGRKRFAAWLKSSTAEKVSLLNINIPLLVLKRRVGNQGLLQSIKDL
ncbi:MAG: universal stress protein, partial [Bacteroidota bacterium]